MRRKATDDNFPFGGSTFLAGVVSQVVRMMAFRIGVMRCSVQAAVGRAWSGNRSKCKRAVCHQGVCGIVFGAVRDNLTVRGFWY